MEVSANPSTRERKKIHQWYYRADDLEHKTALLVHLLKQPEATRSIVFVRKRERVRELANWLREAGINNCYLEGEMVQGKRNEAIKRLTEGRVNVLVATDVAARGIDIPDVSHVFNFDMPRSGDTYLHRIGRTARAGRKGTAISLVEAHDHLLLGKVGRYIEEPIKARAVLITPGCWYAKRSNWQAVKVLAKRAEKKKAKEKEKPRVKKRHRDTKNIGKRRKPAERACHRKRQKSNFNAGFKPGIIFIPAKNTLQHLNKSVHRRANRFSSMVCAHGRNGLRLFAKRQFSCSFNRYSGSFAL
ncbi:ATP-dependent RNA helicase SrmB [Escherichia coli]|nr:ATP-dependent RNA helicase SrmB [Escherichia coli]